MAPDSEKGLLLSYQNSERKKKIKFQKTEENTNMKKECFLRKLQSVTEL